MRIRTIALLCAPVSFILVGTALGGRGDILNDKMRQFAGANAIDCGAGRSETMENNLVRGSVKRAAQDACATKAFRAKKPYFVRYDEIAIDRDGETVTLASSMNRPGEVKFWNYQWRAKLPITAKGLTKVGGAKSHWLASAPCAKPIVYQNAVGCGTKECVWMDTIQSAGSIIFTKSRDRLSPSE